MIEEPSPSQLHGRRDHESELVNQALLEERLGQRDAAVDPDVATGLAFEIGDKLGETVIDVTLETRGATHITAISHALREAGFRFERIQ